MRRRDPCRRPRASRPADVRPRAERPKKAQALIDTITDVGTRPIVAGYIIELKATVEELHIRTRRKHKQWPDHELARLLYEIDQVYGPVKRSTVWTSGRNAAAVAKEIARIIFLGGYEPVDVQAELAKHAGPADA